MLIDDFEVVSAAQKCLMCWFVNFNTEYLKDNEVLLHGLAGRKR